MSDLAVTQAFPFRELVNILVRRRRLVLTIAIFITTVICTAVLLLSFQYTAKAQLEIEPQQVGLVGGQAGVFQQPADEPSVQTELTAITAQDHLRHVLDSLIRDPAFRAAEATVRSEATAKSGTLWNDARVWLRNTWLGLIGASGDLTLRQLERHLNVYQERGSHAITVAYTAIDPREAALVANRVAMLYVELRGDQKRAATDRALAWLGERLPEVKRDAERLEAAAREYRGKNSYVDTNRSTATDGQLADLNRQLTEAKADLAAHNARIASVIRDRLHGGNTSAVIDNLGSPALVELHRRELALAQGEATLTFTMTDTNPRIQVIRNQLAEVRRQISRELDRAIANLQSETQTSAARVASIEQRLERLETSDSDVHLRLLEREGFTTRQLYETLLQRREELNQQRQSLSAGVHILSLAWPPERPSSPNPLLFAAPALIASLICGSLLAVAKERLDKTLRSERDVSRVLGVPCLGLIPQIPRSAAKHPHDLLLRNPFDPYTEAIRSLVASVYLTAKEPPKVVLVSSSVPGEGKTTLAVSFAAYTALLGKRVLLLDLDFRNPQVLSELGGNAASDVPDLSQSEAPSSELILHSSNPRLDYLPTRRYTTDPMTAFMAGDLPRRIRALRAMYDCVVIDSAPVLAVTETRILASLADKVIFAVKWGSTRPDVVQNALDLLGTSSSRDKTAPDTGIVITQVDLKKHARYHYGDSGEVMMRYSKYYPSRGRTNRRAV